MKKFELLFENHFRLTPIPASVTFPLSTRREGQRERSDLRVSNLIIN